MARCLGVPRLACSITGGGVVSPAAGSLRLRRLDGRRCRGVDLLVGPGNDLVVVLDVLLLGTSGCVPGLACNVALGLSSRGGSLIRGGNAVGLELGQTGVCGGRV